MALSDDLSQSGDANSNGDESRHPLDFQGLHTLIAFQHSATLATTDFDDTDSVLLFEFPATAYLDLDSVSVIADNMDSHGTPTHTFDVGIGDSDGTIDTELINDSSITNGGGRDNVDSTDLDTQRWLDVGGKYLIMTSTADPATAAAGDITVEGMYAPYDVSTSAAA